MRICVHILLLMHECARVRMCVCVWDGYVWKGSSSYYRSQEERKTLGKFSPLDLISNISINDYWNDLEKVVILQELKVRCEKINFLIHSEAAGEVWEVVLQCRFHKHGNSSSFNRVSTTLSSVSEQKLCLFQRKNCWNFEKIAPFWRLSKELPVLFKQAAPHKILKSYDFSRLHFTLHFLVRLHLFFLVNSQGFLSLRLTFLL